MSRTGSDWGGIDPTRAESDPNPAADAAGVDPDDEPDERAPDCADCGSPTVAFVRASELDESLPDKPLCRLCILERSA